MRMETLQKKKGGRFSCAEQGAMRKLSASFSGGHREKSIDSENTSVSHSASSLRGMGPDSRDVVRVYGLRRSYS
jgi:hypothetical protein